MAAQPSEKKATRGTRIKQDGEEKTERGVMINLKRRGGAPFLLEEEAVLRRIEERIEARAREFEVLVTLDEIARKRAALLYDRYLNASPQQLAELLYIESVQEYFSGQVRTYLEANGFQTWDGYMKPTLSETENVKMRGKITEDWMRLPKGRRGDPVAMYLLLMKHEVFGPTGPRMDPNGLDWVQDVLAPSE
ncbi:MAG: hypothetical protein AB1657_06190 [Candidatus Micrarchaeota archaeon]